MQVLSGWGAYCTELSGGWINDAESATTA